MYENMQQERDILKKAETRLMEENKSPINQKKGQNAVITNLQTIQVGISIKNLELIPLQSMYICSNRVLLIITV